MSHDPRNGIDIIQLTNRPAGWDMNIRKFATKTLFHESAWLDFMAATVPDQQGVSYFEIRQRNAVIGYFCELLVKKFGFALYECPWLGTTVHQGPVVDRNVDQAELVSALLDAARRNRIASIKLTNDWMEPSLMRRLGFTVTPSVNQVCPLFPDETTVWNAMKGTCRTRIRKAEKAGLIAEETHDLALADYFFEFYREVQAKKGREPAHGIDFPRTLMAHLLPADRLFAIWVKYRGEVIGAAFYAHDERAMYFLDGASDPAHLELSPNELLHWTAMKLAIRRRIPVFNIGGAPAPSRFTQKFGGGLAPFCIYQKSLVPLLDLARQLYKWRYAI